MTPAANPQTRDGLLDAAIGRMLEQGYAATSVEEICAAAGVTKGAFFHYFSSKHALALEAIERFYAQQMAVFAQAPYRKLSDPLERVYGYFDLIHEFAAGPEPPRGCLVGMLAQELAATDGQVRDQCGRCFTQSSQELAADLAAAKAQYCPSAVWTPAGLAEHATAVLQGAMLLAKTTGTAAPLVESLGHLKRYVQLLFPGPD